MQPDHSELLLNSNPAYEIKRKHYFTAD